MTDPHARIVLQLRTLARRSPVERLDAMTRQFRRLAAENRWLRNELADARQEHADLMAVLRRVVE